MFVIFSGVSGAGKQTVINEMMRIFSNCEFVKSATTRAKREGEDIHYHLTPEEFERLQKADQFFEFENVHGFMYGILKKDLQHVIDNPETIFFKDVDVNGTQKVVKFLKGKAKTVTIFLDCPNDVLHGRLLERGESEERAQTRLQRSEMERARKDSYDYVVDNIDLAVTFEKVKKIIEKEQK